MDWWNASVFHILGQSSTSTTSTKYHQLRVLFRRGVCVSSCHIWIKQYHMNRSAVVNISTALIFLCLCVASYMVCVWLWKAEGLHVYGKRDCEWERPRRRLPSRWGEWPLLTDTWLRDGPSHYWTIHCNCNTEIHQSCLCFMLLLMPTI